MFRTGAWVAAVAFAGASLWAGLALTAQEPKPGAGAKSADLGPLREAVAAAARRGENVDEIRKALDALEKALPGAKRSGVPAELQALRDAVEAAAKKGENVDAVQKELATVETALAGRPLARPKPVPPPPEPAPNPFAPPGGLDLFPLPPGGAGVDADAIQKSMDLRMKALELAAKNPRDPEIQKLLTEANQQMMKALRPALGAGGGAMPVLPLGPDFSRPFEMNRVPERARLGIRLEKLPAVAVEQLNLDPNVGIAVTAVLPGSAAEQAGLKVHDVIVEFAGKPASSDADEFIRQVNAAKGGEKLDLVVVRRGKRTDIKGVVLPNVGRGPAPRVDAPDLAPALPLPAVPNLNLELRLLPPQLTPAPVPAPKRDTVVDIRAEVPEAAKPDLDDLRDAVTAAEKRGENVGAVRTALTALEKTLAKGAVKPGAAPPELTALREAVESAVKKGENVAGIARELGAVEKLVTGREYERPQIEEPKAEPVPPFPPRRLASFPPQRLGTGFGGAGGFGRPARQMPDGFAAVIVSVTNDRFTVTARKEGLTFALGGTMGENGPTLSRLVVTEGDKEVQADSLEKVPAEHKPTVETLLKMVNR